MVLRSALHSFEDAGSLVKRLLNEAKSIPKGLHEDVSIVEGVLLVLSSTV